MAKLYPIIRLVFPETPPYRLKGHLKHEGKVWSFSNFSGRVGDSDLSGSIHVDTAPKRPMMKADLVSNLLDFDDLAGFIGGKPGTGPGETASEEQKKQAAAEKDSDRIFPDQRYDLKRLRAMDADIRLRAKKILAQKLPIDNLNATLNLNDGVLNFAPAAFGVANGRMEIYSTFDGSKRPSKVKIDARLRQLDLRRFLGEGSMAQKTLGPIGGRVVLAGLVFDTANSVILGEGNIDLRDEKVDILVIPKHFSPLSLRSYIRVTGGFKNLSVFPDPIRTGTDTLFKKIFNVLTMLVLSPLQPRDLGLGKDVDCDGLIASVEKQDPQGVVLKDIPKPTSGATTVDDPVKSQTKRTR